MNYYHLQNKELENINIIPNSHPNELYNQKQYQQNINNSKNYKPKIQNNLINSEFDYQEDFSHPQVSNTFIPYNNFINNTNNNKFNNNIINNNLIYQDYNEPNIYNQEQNSNYYLDPKRKKQEECKKMLDEQRLQNYEIQKKKRGMLNYNFTHNNINENTNKYITKPQVSEEERIKNKNKQMEYHETLRKQIEEKNRRKEMEKKKEKEEDLKIEEKIKKLEIEEQQKEENLKKQKFIKKNKEQEEMNIIKNDLNQNFNNNFINNIQNNNNNFDNQLEGACCTSPKNNIENSSKNNLYNQRMNNCTNETQSLMTILDKSLPSNQNNFDNNFNNTFQKNNFNRYQIEKYYMNLVQEQLGIINEYEGKLNDSYCNCNYNQLLNEKNEALKQIETSQNNFKNITGILPMNEQYNNRIVNILDMVLEQKVKEIKSNNYKNYEKNNINIDNNIKIGVDDNNNNFDNQNFKSTGSFNLDEMSLSEKKNINEFGIDQSQNERNLTMCKYKSKYEELKESMINGDSISNELKTSMSLAGISKFVVQNNFIDKNKINYISDNDNFNDLYVTWKVDNFNNNKISKNKSNDNNYISNKKSIKISNNNIPVRESNQNKFKIEELNNNDEMEKNNNLNKNYIPCDSSEDININPHVSSIRNKDNSINNDVGFGDNTNLDDSYLNKINEQLQKKPQNTKFINGDKNYSIFAEEDKNSQINNNYNKSIGDNLNVINSNEDFLNMENLNDDIIYQNNYNTKDSQEVNNILNNISNKNSIQTSSVKDSKLNSNIINFNKDTKLYESDEDVIIGNMSIYTISKNNSICNSKNISMNANLKNNSINNNNLNFAGTGKTNSLINNMKLNEVEEKDEEDIYESEFEKDKNTLKKMEEEEKYEDEFENGSNEIEKLEIENSNKNEVNLDDYKDIYESQKIQTQLNFFEDSIIENININKSRGHRIDLCDSNNNSDQNKKSMNGTSNNFGQNNGVMESSDFTNNKTNKFKESKIINNNMISSELEDSYGDNIIKNLDKFRRLALEESNISQSIYDQK